jgi:L-alanine-DL-glutamate epimerase-like enolase superfamily enzyme
LLNRIERLRGNDNNGPGQFEGIVDIALWDIAGKAADLPLYRLLGGNEGDRRIPAYASGLAYGRDEAAVRDLYNEFEKLGFDAAKVKVGYSTVNEDIARLQLVRDSMDATTIMADANEAFTAKEALRRWAEYCNAGIDLYWFEDPILRNDIQGLRRLAREMTTTHLNVGEYLDTPGKGEVLSADAVDMLNIHGLTPAYRSAILANRHGVGLSMGNTPASVGVHAAVALPEVTYIEFSRTGWNELVAEPVRVEDGHAIAPNRPGHGLQFKKAVLENKAE